MPQLVLQNVSEQFVPVQTDFEQFDWQDDEHVVVFVEFEQFVVVQLAPVQFLTVQFDEEHDTFEPQVVLHTVLVQFVPEQFVLVQLD